MKDYITLTYWRLGHPLPVESASDFYYVNFTRRLYHTIRNTDVGRQSTEDWVAETAMTLAYYLEDVISGLGFWRTFVTKHKALYGKYLPFFEVDEKDYYLDEINQPDVCFLLWMSVQDNKREALVNPENPYLTELSEMLYRQLDKEFERAPINDDLLAQLKNPDTYSDFSRLSLVGMKMLGGTYLFRPFVKMTEGVVVREVNSLLTPGTQLSLREYTVRFMQVFDKNTGILALRGAEWMSAWLELWGLPDESRRVAEMEVVPLAYYRLQTYDAENLTLEGFDGTTYTLPRDAFQPLVEQLMNINKVCLTTLVHYGDTWTTAGAVSWYPTTDLFEQYRTMMTERRKINEEAYRKVMEGNAGRPIVYFQDWTAFMDWAKQHLELEEQFKPTREMERGKCLVLFASPEEGMTLVPNEARFICDGEHNPCYNAGQARRGSLSLLITPGNLSTRMLHYLLDNRLLPDAALSSAKDAEHGKQLVQENMDFIARFMRTADY